MARKVKLGQALVTIGVLELCRFGLDLGPLFERHASGDWGDADERTGKANDQAVAKGGRITSVYHPNGRRIWLVTEADRSRTVAMLPHEKE
ncbi:MULTISPECIES: hypothetical protein [Pseudomonas syringae group]|uniref:hypothetical protein n=1 Tax=Pseudomonas syringae group TaxID=136849 RepID=UPI0006B8FB28|nr:MULTISPECIES: hypothetical protein [Pseudomonas syringae group]KPB82015.1 Uncharacterized protein AC505_0330 [Pseudomonas syringae pv. maculicola]NAP32603.1 hypothetical protein [Pseudomonas syringae]